MQEPTPYGAWASPISARDVAEGARRIDDLAAAGDRVCWIERRPEEGGRNVLVCRRPDGATETLTPAGYDVRSRVHEYGGGAFCLRPGNAGVSPASGAPPLSGAPEPPHAFVNFQDQRVYLAGAGPPIPLTPADGAHYADLTPDPHRRRLIAVQERPDPAGGEEIAALVAIPLPTTAPDSPSPSPEPAGPPPPTELVSGADFYSSPRLSPDGSKLAWLSWNHPDMPWDATELRLADLDESGLPVTPRLVAGGDAAAPEAIQQPSFDAHGRLTFISDRSGWWNLYRLDLAGTAASASSAPGNAGILPASGAQRRAPPRIHPLLPRDAEFGVPPWLFGMSTYAHTASGIVAACCDQGVWRLLFLPEAADPPPTTDTAPPQPVPIPSPYTSISWLRAGAAPTDTALFLGAAPDRHAELVRLGLPGGAADSSPGAANPEAPELEVLATTGPAPDPRYLSRGRPIDFPSAGGRRAFAFFYPPKNDDEQAPPGAKPPLIVKSHGGPTSAAEHVYDPGVQYWTSRGFAVA